MEGKLKKDRDLWKDYKKRMDANALRLSFLNHIHYTRAKDEFSATEYDKYLALAYTVRDRMVERWSKTQQSYYNEDVKRVYYLSLEFLLGRLLLHNIVNLDIYEDIKYVVKKCGYDFDGLLELEPDAALGNGGLGRLAACFLDSMATLGLPGYGYGLRYEFGIFKQVIKNGFQVEEPDEWLKFEYPWEIERPEYSVNIRFYGKVIHEKNEFGETKFKWVDTKDILAIPHDIPMIGYGNNTVNTLRLWSARASNQFDLEIFNQGDYVKAVEDKNYSENISKVLYPSDSVYEGKELRLKQEYFFAAASISDIVRRYLKTYDDFERFPDRVAIQLNDTHPAIAVPELMRVLLDEHNLKWERAWDITRQVFAFTNHTVMQEALERWPVALIQKMFPRHMQIIFEINRRFLNEVRLRFPGNEGKVRDMSIIEDGAEKSVRMANLAVVASHSVNGVAKLHTEILKTRVFRDFDEMFPERINNKTNAITQRRWLLLANHGLSKLVTEKIGDGWIKNLEELKKFEEYENDESLLLLLYKVKEENKKRLAKHIEENKKIEVDMGSIFDAHIKRIHEYKRQLLNVFHIMSLYKKLKDDPAADITPRTFIFAGKAAPGYLRAKLIIKLINSVGELVNGDRDINGKIKVVFLENYGVTLAEKIIPASDISEQISTAGKEASGTGNMKFALNGAITIGTLDGANIEIMERVGRENFYVFGLTAEEVADLLSSGSYDPWELYKSDANIKWIVDTIKSGELPGCSAQLLRPIYDSLMYGADGNPPDQFFVLRDFSSYAAAQEKINFDFRNRLDWQKKAIKNISNMGYFSSDRAVREYAEEIWKVKEIDISL
ncbi:MAG: glycogen/starch/alpha-glucan phosphorylase [Elusimicrobia bacterium]|nr:glycogen/starch/alpha-glucan phosphorylase [Elusimicrobiota bacterium]